MFRNPTKSRIRLPAVALVALLFLTSDFVFLQPALATFPGANGKIAFTHTAQPALSGIWVINPDGSGMNPITPLGGDYIFPEWSSNGSKILCQTPSEPFGLWIMNPDGSNLTNLIRGYLASRPVGRPTWSFDGSKIAAQYLFGSFLGIYVWNANDASPPLQLTNQDSDQNPAWSPDGLKIAFERYPTNTNGDIYVMNSDGSNQHPLTTNPANDHYPSWSPDSSRIAFSSERTGKYEIYVMNADGSGVTQLTFSNSSNTEPAWSPDGSKIAFTTDRDGNQEIYVMNADGSHVTRLTFNNADDSQPDRQPLLTRSPRRVGGVVLHTNRFEILTSYLALAGLVAVVSVVVVIRKRG